MKVSSCRRARSPTKKEAARWAASSNLAENPDRTWSVRDLRGGLVRRCILVVRGRRSIGGGVALDPVQEIIGGLQRLVVLGVRRDIGLRAGLLFALDDLQVAAQRGFAAGVGARLQLFRHVL